MSDKPLFAVRALQDSDIPFLYSSYLKSYRPYFNHLGNDDYFELHHLRMEKFLERGAIGAVAVATDDHDVILGWVLLNVTEDTVVVFYTYVKHAFRSLGVASKILTQLSDLLQKQQIVLLQMTPGGSKLKEKIGRNCLFSPYFFELQGDKQ